MSLFEWPFIVVTILCWGLAIIVVAVTLVMIWKTWWKQ